MRPAAETLAPEFERRYGIPVRLNFGGSADLLSSIELGRQGDLYLPHDPYAAMLEEKGLLEDYEVVGLVALVWAIGLGATSSGKAMRLLGIKPWKWFQSTGAYVLFSLVAVHTLYHAWLRPRFSPRIIGYIYAALLLIVLILQMAAYTKTVLNAKGIRLSAGTRVLILAAIIVGFAGAFFRTQILRDSQKSLPLPGLPF